VFECGLGLGVVWVLFGLGLGVVWVCFGLGLCLVWVWYGLSLGLFWVWVCFGLCFCLCLGLVGPECIIRSVEVPNRHTANDTQYGVTTYIMASDIYKSKY
jgi:hypothetical protein